MQLKLHGLEVQKKAVWVFDLYVDTSNVLLSCNPLLLHLGLYLGNALLNWLSQSYKFTIDNHIESMQYILSLPLLIP